MGTLVALMACQGVPTGSTDSSHCDERQAAADEALAGSDLPTDRFAYLVLSSPECFDSDDVVAARTFQSVMCESDPQRPGEPGWLYRERLEDEQRLQRLMLSCNM